MRIELARRCWPPFCRPTAGTQSVKVVPILLGFVASVSATEPDEAAWRYVVPTGEAGLGQPVAQSVLLSLNGPDEFTDDVGYRGQRRWYGQLRYGTPDSTRVAVVIDDLSDGQFDLYVDLNRNRIVQSKERIEGEGRTRQVQLPAEIRHDDLAEHQPRTVLFRRGLARNSISVATVGYLEGSAEMNGRDVRVRRVDATANGFFADGRDRLWIDLNADGRWDPFAEQFPCLAVLPLDGRRFAVRSNAYGTMLEFAEIEGTGTVELQFATLVPKSRIRELDVMLIGEDGSAVSVRDAGKPMVVPVGRYAFGTVSLVVEHPETATPWRFVFSRYGPLSEGVWHSVAKDERVTLDPLGKLAFSLKVTGGEAGIAAADAVSVQPQLKTADGLLINTCSIGRDDEASAQGCVKLLSAAGDVLAQEHSGFA